MTIQTKSTNAPSRGAEQAAASNAAISERRPLSQYILAERATDEERDDEEDFGWTIFDSENENEREGDGLARSGRDLSVLKRIKRFLNDDANDAVCGACANEGNGAGETERVGSVDASFFDDEQAVAPTRSRVAYPFYDGARKTAKNGEKRPEPSFVVGCAADSELIFEPRVAWNGVKRRVQKEKNDASEGESGENAENEGNGEKNEVAETALISGDLLKIETTESTENASIGENAEIAECAPIDESAETAECAPIDESAETAESAPPQTFVVDFSETIAKAAACRTAESDAEAEKKPPTAPPKRRKNVKIDEIEKKEDSATEVASVESTRKTSQQAPPISETNGDAEAFFDRVEISGVWPEANEILPAVDANPILTNVENETNDAFSTGWKVCASCANGAGNGDGAICVAEAINDRAAKTTKKNALREQGRITKKNGGGERRFGAERDEAGDGRSIFRRFVQLAAASERRNRKRVAGEEIFAENREPFERSPQNVDAFGEAVSLIVAPTFAESDAVFATWETAAISTFDAILSSPFDVFQNRRPQP